MSLVVVLSSSETIWLDQNPVKSDRFKAASTSTALYTQKAVQIRIWGFFHKVLDTLELS